jgi:hypothetical protein
MGRHALLICISAVLAFGLVTDEASARGGSRGGRAGARAVTAGQRVLSPTGQSSTVPDATNRATADPPGATSSATTKPGAAAFAAETVLGLLGAPPAPPTPPTAAPNSGLAAPISQLPVIAPPSQPLPPPTQVATESSTVVRLSFEPPSTGPVTPSPAPSTGGGGGNTVEDCMRLWDKATHMSKSEWRASCARSLHRFDAVTREIEREPAPSRPR